jgi:hypothetical protein
MNDSHPSNGAGRHETEHILGKKQQNQDIESRLRELTERTRRTRRELEELIQHPEADRTRALSNDHPQFFRRRRARDQK